MGNFCCSALNSKEREVKHACKYGDPASLQTAFSSSADHVDFFKIISDPRSKVQFDFFVTLVYNVARRVQEGKKTIFRHSEGKMTETPFEITPFLEIFKKELEKNKKSTEPSLDSTTPQFDKIGGGYLEIFVSYFPDDLKGFTFLLDNADWFPLVNPDTSVPNCLLHRLICHPDGFPLLQDYLSSGQVLERFKNVNISADDDETVMHHPEFGTWTPLEIAAFRLNVPAVQELCVAKVGGTNFKLAFEIMCSDTLQKHGGLDVGEKKKSEQAAIDIFLTLIAQPGAADSIRTVGSKAYLKWDEGEGLPIQSIYSLEQFLGARLIKYEYQVHLPIIMLAHGYEKFFLTLMSNRCELLDSRIKREFGEKQSSSTLWQYCDECSVDDVVRMLVTLRVQDWLIDIDAVDQKHGTSPLQITNQRIRQGGRSAGRYPFIRDLLVGAGAVNS